MAEKTIMYVKPGCPYCQAAREDLRKRGIAFEEVDVTKDPAGLVAMLQKTGGDRTVPTIVTGDEVQIGFKGG